MNGQLSQPTDDVDSSEHFHRAQGAGAMRTPNPLFAELPEIYSAVGYDAVFEILRDGVRFD